MTREETWLLNEKYGGEKSFAFFADCERLAAGEPLGYVIGYVPFLDCTIHLDSRPLIPRVETEYWVERAIAAIREAGDTQRRPLRVLDMCAGSGCIGVAVAAATPDAAVTFAEIDPVHLPTIQKNLDDIPSVHQRNNDRYQIVQSDLFANVSGTFDYILTNPPYIDPALDRTDPSVKDYEPAHALYGGTNGMEVISQLIQAVPQHLAHGGAVWLEHEPEQVTALKDCATACGLTAAAHSDQYGTPRYSILTRRQT